MRVPYYKEKMKHWNDCKILHFAFRVEEQVLLFNLRLKHFSGTLKSKWIGPYKVTTVYQNGAIEIEDIKGIKFTVNGQ